jgi:1-acyl-sn-glycerol-3-phosphate acyltransferase
MTDNIDFESIRPYRDEEVPMVFERLTKEQSFLRLLKFLYPDVPTDKFVDRLRAIKTIDQFQHDVIYSYLKGIMKNTTDGVTASGLENLDSSKNYLFISNHRDIVLDSAFLNIMLMEHGFSTTEIAIGDNLLIYPWITDLVKLNKSFIVKRNLPIRQMMDASSLLSLYIRNSIMNRGQSIWIAQREGRSKDGDDRTQISLLKMFNISGEGEIIENFEQLNIVPVSISYEYDPCDYLKAFEFQQKRDIEGFKKSQADDLTAMATGLGGRKGRVHFSFGKPLNEELKQLPANENKNEVYNQIAEMIDRQIHHNYRLWPANYIALDIFKGTKKFTGHYTDEDVTEFLEYVYEHISRLESDEDFVFMTIMEMYANPAINAMQE